MEHFADFRNENILYIYIYTYLETYIYIYYYVYLYFKLVLRFTVCLMFTSNQLVMVIREDRLLSSVIHNSFHVLRPLFPPILSIWPSLQKRAHPYLPYPPEMTNDAFHESY